MYSLLSPPFPILPFPFLLCARHPALSIFLSLYSRAEHDDRRLSILFSLPRPLSPPPLLPPQFPSRHVARIIYGALHLVWDYYVSFRASETNAAIFDVRCVSARGASRVRARARFSNFTIEDNSVARY